MENEFSIMVEKTKDMSNEIRREDQLEICAVKSSESLIDKKEENHRKSINPTDPSWKHSKYK